jgi:hypothetical protein
VYVEEQARWKANARRETDSLVSTDERGRRPIAAKNFESEFRNESRTSAITWPKERVIDGRLPALRAVVAGEVCAAILALRQRSMSIFVSTELAPVRSSLDNCNRCVTEDNFCRFIGPSVARLQKDFLCVD